MLVYAPLLPVPKRWMRFTGGYERLLEKHEVSDKGILVLEKVDFLPLCQSVRQLARSRSGSHLVARG